MKLRLLLAAIRRAEDRAADDLLLEALRLGNDDEKAVVLDTLIERGTAASLGGVLALYATLPERLRNVVVKHATTFYHALSHAGRSPDKPTRLAAIEIIAASRQGKLGYVLSENLRETDEDLSRASCEALLDMARWVHRESRGLHRLAPENADGDLLWVGDAARNHDSTVTAAPTAGVDLATAYAAVMRQRPEIESAVARALDWVRTKHLADLMRAALLLCDHPQSRVLAILKTVRHGGQAAMARKLQQPPAADHVEAFLLGASHGHLRGNFSVAMAQSNDTAVFDALLRRTHWLADAQLSACIGSVSRGVWWDADRIDFDLARRKPADAMRVADWVAASGLSDADQDARLLSVRDSVQADSLAKLHVLRVAAARPRQTSVALLVTMLDDADERFVRIAAREIIRRRPTDYENLLLQRMTGGNESVRRVIGRAIGHAGFAMFWNRFDTLGADSRIAAGRAMLKLVPDAPVRLGRYLNGTAEERVRAMQALDELGLAGDFRQQLERQCTHPHPKVRSKAAGLLALSEKGAPATSMVLTRMLDDHDARVRANAIEVVEKLQSIAHVPMLGGRTRSASSRERANAIKALHGLGVTDAVDHLRDMLGDSRPEHRVSALWTLRQAGVWGLLRDVGTIAQRDDSLRVRRYAIALLKGVIDQLQRPNGPGGPPKKVA